MYSLNVIMYINDICLVLFCLPWGVIAALPALIHARLHEWAGSFLPRTEPYRQTKLYAKCLLFGESGADRNITLIHK